MITIIASTNRTGSFTNKIAAVCYEILQTDLNENIRFLSLESLNNITISKEMYNESGQHPAITQIQDEVLVPADKWLIISPEYNGSFPGILKYFIDAISVRKYSETFKGKKVALIGVGTGRGGNLRGMEHLTGFLNYLKMIVMPEKLPISSVHNMFEGDQLMDGLTKNELNRFLHDFTKF
ncbi:MAG: NAD(P)H-dependent oxidoreductase [Saprospiraceae bacterium]|nr:NAD(P)H-dependent oxidoreductase [Saprospiraceae bacterium]